LRGEQHVLAEHDAVAHLDEVIELRPGLDPRLADGRPIDGRVGANLDIVFDHDRARLRNLLMRSIGARRKPVAIAAHHRAVLDDHPRADGAPFAN
jgi:hypothetical protein